jgi:hypothetical protein
MYIEDILDNLVGFGSWQHKGTVDFIASRDLRLLTSFNDQAQRSLGFTEKQSTLCVTMLTKYTNSISLYLNRDISIFLENPQFRIAKRTINQEKNVKIVLSNEIDQAKIKLSFPYDEGLVGSIKEYRSSYLKQRQIHWGMYTSGHIDWNMETRTWDFNLCEEHVAWIHSALQNKGFIFDENFINFVAEIENIKNNIENHVPMVIFNQSQFEYKNIHKNIPQPNSNHLLEVLFDAKKYGISTWDENIDLALEDNSINDFTRHFLKTEKPEIELDTKIFQLVDLEDIVTYSKNVVVVVPGGSELESLRQTFKFFTSIGIQRDEMTVLFRLDSSAGKMCNEFVKENQLNNPITDKIKIIFISIKVPKPLLSSGKTIDAIINLGQNSAHYSVRNLLKNHHCVINCSLTKQKREERFGNL